ncbi:MAG: hypothetical protein JSS71_13115 [Armatimonadetes bacterium]|nr:hypothetical protein [Armatimonadota bacterium]
MFVEPVEQEPFLSTAELTPVLTTQDVQTIFADSLTFEDFIDPRVRSTRIHERAVDTLRSAAARDGIDLGNLALQVSRVQSDQLLVRFNDAGYSLLQQKDGTFKAVTQDAMGRFHEIGNVDPVGMFLNKLAGGAAAVVSLAHMISAADLAKSTAKLLDKVDLLIALRSIDQFEDLRTFYDRLIVLLGAREVDWDAVERITLEVARLRNRLVAEAEHLAANWRPLVPKRGWWVFGRAREALDHSFVDTASPGYQTRYLEYESLCKRMSLSQACLHLEDVCWSLKGEAHRFEPQREKFGMRLHGLANQLAIVEADLLIENGYWSELSRGFGSSNLQNRWAA